MTETSASSSTTTVSVNHSNNEEKNNNSSSEATFFLEEERIQILLRKLCAWSGQRCPDDCYDCTDNDILVEWGTIFDRYLEAPTLLDPFLESWIQQLAQSVLEGWQKLRASLEANNNNNDNNWDCTETEITEDHMPYSVGVMFIQGPLAALYSLCKVRGYKIVQRFLPHDVDDIIPVYTLLRQAFDYDNRDDNTNNDDDDDDPPDKNANTSESRRRHTRNDDDANNNNNSEQNSSLAPPWAERPIWEARYVLWHWMGALSLVPLDLQRSLPAFRANNKHNHDDDDDDDDDDVEHNVITSIVHAAMSEAFRRSGPVATAASVAVARWTSRPDAHQQRTLVLQELQSRLDAMNQQHHNTTTTSTQSQLEGVLQIVCGMLKFHTSSSSFGQDSTPDSQQDSSLVCELESINNLLSASLGGSSSSSFLLEKLWMKFTTRFCAAQLPSKVLTWRYQRGHRLLQVQRSSQRRHEETVNPPTEESNPAPMETQSKEETCAIDESAGDAADDDDLFHVPDAVEDGVGRLLIGLGHPSTVVRWSAAKGLGRVVMRLPKLCGLDVVDAVVETMQKNEDDERIWHGAGLGLAELARRGLLLPTSLPLVIPLLIRAVEFDIVKGATSVGASVRDAACYTYWAMCRSYSSDVLSPFLAPMTSVIVTTSVLDREVNCRRAASAAFQEAVGRQEIPHGIPILTVADYYSLGNRRDAFTTIAYAVAKCSDHGSHLISVLSTKKLFHWDCSIRLLAAESLGKLAPLEPDLLRNIVIPQLLPLSLDPKHLNVRHGAVWGIAEIVLGLSRRERLSLEENVKSDLRLLVPTMEKKRLYRGRGGEIMRSAVCRLVECMASAGVGFNVAEQVRLLDSVDASIPHPNEDISQAACRALAVLMTEYFPVSEKGPSARLQARVVDKFVKKMSNESNPAAVRGYALALGHLPTKLLAWNEKALKRVLSALIAVANPSSKVGGVSDAESRRNAIDAATMIAGKTLVSGGESPVLPCPIITIGNLEMCMVWEALFNGLKDYQIDRRGDVGSWARLSAMRGLCKLACEAPPALLSADLIARAVAALAKQVSEKIDSVRECAGESLTKLLCTDRLSTMIPQRHVFLSALPGNNSVVKSINWAESSTAFPFIEKVVLRLFSINSHLYFSEIVEGLILSAGGLTETIRNASLSVLFKLCTEAGKAGQQRVATSLAEIYGNNLGTTRVTLPLLKTVDKLVTNRGFDKSTVSSSRSFATLMDLMKRDSNIGHGVKRLLLIGNVCCSCYTAADRGADIKCQAVDILMTLIGKEFPVVRKAAAEYLYLVFSESAQHRQAAELVERTPWNAEVDKSTLDSQVSALRQLLNGGI